MMRLIVILLFGLLAQAMEHKSEVSLRQINYENFSNETEVLGQINLKHKSDDFTTNISLEYLYSLEYYEKRYLMINEVFVTKEYEDYSLSFGKLIKYWGELEGFNIADVYNQKNYLLDPFNKSAKLGSWGLNLSKYFDESSLELGVKFYEQNQKYPDTTSPYYPFFMEYDENLQLSKKPYSPTLHIAYSFTNSTLMDTQTKFILLHGYDNKRYLVPKNNTALTQYAYRVNKLLLLLNALYKDTIFKCEAGYTDVISDEKMSDYAQLSFGMENNFYNLYGFDIGLFTEYYRYIYMQEKIENVDISEIYNNDIFLAMKLNFNDVRSSYIKGGVLYDVQNEERVFKVEAKSRVADEVTAEVSFLKSFTSEKSVLTQIGRQTTATFTMTYMF